MHLFSKKIFKFSFTDLDEFWLCFSTTSVLHYLPLVNAIFRRFISQLDF